MSINSLVRDKDVEVTNEDTLGGGFILDTGLYPMIIDVAYLGKSRNGAISLNLHLKQANGRGLTVRQTIYITSGDAKGNKTHYIGQDKKKHDLPGYALADLISQIAADMNVASLTSEKKMVKLYNFEIGAEQPTEVDQLSELMTRPILVGLRKVRSNKMVRNQDGSYDPLPDERFFNEIHKVFYPDRFTVAEKSVKADKAAFADTWEGSFDASYVQDKFKTVAAGPPQADDIPGNGAGTGSLFEND